MKILKDNYKILIAFITGLILASGIVYAATSANQVNYTRAGTNITNIGEALNDLYGKVPSGSQEITANGTYNIANKASVNVNVSVPSGYYQLDSLTNAASASDIITGKKAYSSTGEILTGSYTPITTMKGTEWNSGSFNQAGYYNIPVGFKPTILIMQIRSTEMEKRLLYFMIKHMEKINIVGIILMVLQQTGELYQILVLVIQE